MMKKIALSLLVLTLAPAQALKLTVWDRDLSSKVGVGESSGTKFNVQLVRDYAGPVIVLFSQTDDEKRGGQFAGLLSRYDGLLKGGQLTLFTPADPDKPTERSVALNTAASPALAGSGLSLGKLLQPFKLSVVLQPTSSGPGPGNLSLMTDGTGAGRSGFQGNRPATPTPLPSGSQK